MTTVDQVVRDAAAEGRRVVISVQLAGGEVVKVPVDAAKVVEASGDRTIASVIAELKKAVRLADQVGADLGAAVEKAVRPVPSSTP